MAALYNLARMTTATVGNGTITLGVAVPGYLSFGLSGVPNGATVDYSIYDFANNASEDGTGVYTAAGPTLTRNPTKSTNGNAAIVLSGHSHVYITPRAETLNDTSLFKTGQLPLERGGTEADLSITGGAGQFVRQSSAGAPFTVSAISSADLPGLFSGFANPTSLVGVSAVNGAATTAMRSDGAPAIDASMSPTWAGTHTFTNPPVFSNQPGSRTALGLGTIATQDSTNVSLTGGSITGMPSPSMASDVAIKSYVDGLAGAGFHILTGGTARVATAAVLPDAPAYANGAAGVGATLTATVNAAIIVDGVTLSVSDRVLVKDQASALQNGVYIVTDTGSGGTKYILTRTTDCDTPAEISNAYILITAGSVNISSSWVSGTTGIIGTDPVNWTQFSAQSAVTSVAGRTGVVTLSNTDISGLGTFATQNYATPPVIGGTTPNDGHFSNASVDSTGVFGTNAVPSVNFRNGPNPSSIADIWQTAGANRWAVGKGAVDASENFNLYSYGTASFVQKFNYSTGQMSLPTGYGTGTLYSDASGNIISSGAVNVKSFGAACDGFTDDTAAINAAFASGANHFIIPGICNVTGLNSPPAGARISGTAPGVSAFRTTSATLDVLPLTGVDNVAIDHIRFLTSVTRTAGAYIKVTGCRATKISEFFMDGAFNGIDLESTTLVNILNGTIDNTVNARIIINLGFDVRIENFVGDNGQGVGLDQSVYGIQILELGGGFFTDIGLIHSGTGLSITPTGANHNVTWLNFVACNFDSGSGSGIYIEPSNSALVYGMFFHECWASTNSINGVIINQLTGAKVDYVSFHGLTAITNTQRGVIATAGSDLTFIGGMIAGNSFVAPGNFQGMVFTNIDGLIIQGAISGKAFGVDTQLYGIDIEAGCNNYIVTGNRCPGNTGGGFVDNALAGNRYTPVGSNPNW